MTRYPVLMLVSGLVKMTGWVFIVLGGLLSLLAGYDLLEALNRGGFDGGSNLQTLAGAGSGVVRLSGGITGTLIGLVAVAFGESIRVVVDIAHNTSFLISGGSSGNHVCCPLCHSWVPEHASICRYCRFDLGSARNSAGAQHVGNPGQEPDLPAGV